MKNLRALVAFNKDAINNADVVSLRNSYNAIAESVKSDGNIEVADIDYQLCVLKHRKTLDSIAHQLAGNRVLSNCIASMDGIKVRDGKFKVSINQNEAIVTYYVPSSKKSAKSKFEKDSITLPIVCKMPKFTNEYKIQSLEYAVKSLINEHGEWVFTVSRTGNTLAKGEARPKIKTGKVLPTVVVKKETAPETVAETAQAETAMEMAA